MKSGEVLLTAFKGKNPETLVAEPKRSFFFLLASKAQRALADTKPGFLLIS